MCSDFFDAKSLSKYLNVSLRTLETLIKSNDIPPYILIGRQRRWFKQDVTAYLNSKKLAK